MTVKVEICVDSIASLHVAAQMRVDRIELCSALALGGLTPTAGVIKAAQGVGPEIHAMIRPRPGDFIYDGNDLQACLHDIAQMRAAGCDGVVIGVAQTDSTLDTSALRQLKDAADGMQVTLHRVFDLAPDPFAALEQANDLGFTRLLTSGQKSAAGEGAPLIADLARQAAGRIEIMAGGGVTPQTAAVLLRAGVDALHASCAETVASPQDIARIGITPPRHATTDKIKALQQAATGMFGG